MTDTDRINNTMDEAGVGYDTVLRQNLKTLAKAIRADENEACETIAVQNENNRSAEEIRRRKYQEH